MIYKAKKKDLNLLYQIEKNVFKDEIFSLSKESLRYHLNNNLIFIIKYEKINVGYCLWLERKKYYRLYSFAILPKYQGKGLASQLLKYCIEKLKEKSLQLEVRVSNEKAILLYERFAFKKVKVLKDYYKNENAYLMKRV
ncbi:GNAT family N-acetyltransferase [Malaciobacter molluscorum LMG 25693]|uniref:GNAT family N-acetyltransferase n=1 Tax=Malaciobacter molluscorum LMG 25693 TaxID=870501 RepID=A0A2G1DGC4_9BACT|nr:GNAT family N-acetyltransferase [Malaciobacter molluscorum]AXX91735.1 ribosomal-protein-S18-alanine N-acetyltransferase [Malaciobacter molluscorum LMG 25693]PHO17376.1 GNAT family N-acetyltransferase [Malaciobacter molluscorum LMG 25693]